MSDDVKAAEQTLRDLQAKQQALVAHRIEIEESRKRVAYDAHNGDQAARKKLDTINRDAANHASEMASIEAAIAEATARLEAARKAEAGAADRAKAVEVREALRDFVRAGRQLDEAMATLISASNEFKDTLEIIHALGAEHPQHRLVDVNAVRALQSALCRTPWAREFKPVAPGDRKTFKNLVDAWALAIETNFVGPRLGEEKKDAA